MKNSCLLCRYNRPIYVIVSKSVCKFFKVLSMMENLIDRYTNKIQGTLSCFDRIVFTGIIPGICYADGMSGLLRTKDIPHIRLH